ncbi:hypothetical protein ACE6H2_027172 [Prunus campanulata]
MAVGQVGSLAGKLRNLLESQTLVLYLSLTQPNRNRRDYKALCNMPVESCSPLFLCWMKSCSPTNPLSSK